MSLSPKIIKFIKTTLDTNNELLIAFNAFNDAKFNIGNNNNMNNLASETIRLLTVNKQKYFITVKQSNCLTNNKQNKINIFCRGIMSHLKKIIVFNVINLLIIYNITSKYNDEVYSIALIVLLYTSILSSITLYYISLTIITSLLYYTEYDIGLEASFSFIMMFYVYPLFLRLYTKSMKYFIDVN